MNVVVVLLNLNSDHKRKLLDRLVTKMPYPILVDPRGYTLEFVTLANYWHVRISDNGSVQFSWDANYPSSRTATLSTWIDAGEIQ